MGKISKIFLMMIFTLSAIPAWNAYAYDTTDAQDASEKFIKKASISSLYEIESSKVALDKSKNPEVKKIANKLIDDHTAANKKLKEILTKEKLRFPMNLTLDEDHQEKVEELKEASESDFDKEYLDLMLEAHKNAIELFEDFSNADGTHKSLNNYAENTLPKLKNHLEKIKSVKDQL